MELVLPSLRTLLAVLATGFEVLRRKGNGKQKDYVGRVEKCGGSGSEPFERKRKPVVGRTGNIHRNDGIARQYILDGGKAD